MTANIIRYSHLRLVTEAMSFATRDSSPGHAHPPAPGSE